jgi:transposase-like protein
MANFAPGALPAQQVIQSDLLGLFRGAIGLVLEVLLEQQVREMVGARRYERLGSRKDHLNGTYMRRLLTSMGMVELEIPRTRTQGSPLETIGRYKRRTSEIDEMVTAAYVQGVSTRDMSKVTEALMGEGVGRSTVSRVTARLAESVEALRSAPISDPIPYLFLDATFINARWARAVENVSVLVAYGVNHDGTRRLLGVTLGSEESEASWATMLEGLLERGLSGMQLVISDAHAGLIKAVRRLLPEVKHQRCAVHLTRNVLGKTPRRLRGRVAGELRKVFQATSREQALKALETFAAGLGAQVPEALECLREGFAAATRFYDFPQAHWPRIRTNNGLERLNAEIKRRTRAIGAFPDRDSALRLITTVAAEVTAVWAQRRYLDMKLLQIVSKAA